MTDFSLPKGFRVAGVHCGLKADDALDFALIVSDVACVTAGVFTTNMVKAAPVLLGMETLSRYSDDIRAVAVNTGCANAATGEQGLQNARATAKAVADKIGVDEHHVMVMSTGVIGTQLPMDKIHNGIELARRNLGDDVQSTAKAMMTTDTKPKTASITYESEAGSYTITGIAKGAGMIAPNMATMLAVIVTDAKLVTGQAQMALQRANEKTFNCITVDGDMSTNDTVLLLANGESGVVIDSASAYDDFVHFLTIVCEDLAKSIARDGEGATKLVQVNIEGASDMASARKIADAIATSPLVKTAFYGGDPNWGRIMAAAGRAGAPINPNSARLYIATETSDNLTLFENGTGVEYEEARAKAIFSQSEFSITLDLNMGTGYASVWTCDMSHDYISINSHYRS
ncbi:MAG: bifunctional glutamate N-acetyltransferase/amino-acid acetyltransferase ArgJ [Anaerolineae bacterium]|nr:bifunctional glutamate N-acetyltransferase/amino-acid acetyltransferase ArgJ [Anaerolineae bacterium]